MYRTTSLLAVLLLALTAVAFAQEPQLNSQIPEDAFATQQLIAWSYLQKPQPTPQPLPPPDKPLPQPDQPQDQAKPPADPHTEQSPAKSFTGKILKDDGKYVLKVASDTIYQLDEQEGVRQYENETVKVIGTLDPGSNKIHIVKIELLS